MIPSFNAIFFAVTNKQIHEDYRNPPLGRYAIWLQSNEVIRTWESEQHIADLVNTAGFTLENRGVWTQPSIKPLHDAWTQKPPPLTAEQHEIEAEKRYAEDHNLKWPPTSSEQAPVIPASQAAREWWIAGLAVLLAATAAIFLLKRMRKSREKGA